MSSSRLVSRRAKPDLSGSALQHPNAPGNAEEVMQGVTVSHPNKVFWPDAGDGRPVRKRELAQFYEDAADWMLGHIRGRPCSLVRAPDGLAGKQFFQRHVPTGR